MAEPVQTFDVVIVGAGPAGIAAAAVTAGHGLRTALVEDAPQPGGQVWQGVGSRWPWSSSRRWLGGLKASGAYLICGDTAICPVDQNLLLVESQQGSRLLRWRYLVLASGARELLLPFPGWTLPGVFGVAGLGRLIRSGWPIAGKQVVVAGSGPLLLPVALTIRRAGGRVVLVAEQARATRLAFFAAACAYLAPTRLVQAGLYRIALTGVRYKTGCWPTRADGDLCVRQVTIATERTSKRINCDVLACGFGLVPNTELAILLGCQVQGGVVWTDQWQQTSLPGVYAAGEQTCIAGMEHAITTGRIAGLAIAGRKQDAVRLFASRSRIRRLGHILAKAFALSPKILGLADPDTIICRCEDVRTSQLEPYTDWRSARLHTRCGMGTCQGKICGTALRYLRGWQDSNIRPPIMPSRIESLTRLAACIEQKVTDQKGSTYEPSIEYREHKV